jgi:hypothetical protein
MQQTGAGASLGAFGQDFEGNLGQISIVNEEGNRERQPDKKIEILGRTFCDPPRKQIPATT